MIWRPVVGYEGAYEVSYDGQVRGLDRVLPDGRKWKGRILSQSNGSRYGHLGVSLASKRKAVHRLVLEAFVGPCLEGMECAHKDGNPKNNKLENLRWDTRQGNARDAILHGTIQRGETQHNHKLTADDVRRAVVMHKNGMTNIAIGAQLGVTHSAISLIMRGKNWSHVTGFERTRR